MRRLSIIFERWDVALSPFPFVDRAKVKLRPIVVLSSTQFNRNHGLVVTCMITSALGGRWPSDYALTDLAEAGLDRPCVVRWKVFTLEAGALARRLGAVCGADQAALQARLSDIFPGRGR